MMTRSTVIRAALVLLIGIGGVLIGPVTTAGPVTGGSGNAPYTKLAVYDGVVSIVPGTPGTAALELGFRGTDIAASGDIYLRPGSVSQANGARVCADCGGSGTDAAYANMIVPGQVCLYGPSGTVPDCRTDWPAVSGGASFWEQVNDVGLFGLPASMPYLQLTGVHALKSIHLGSDANRVPGTALTVDNFENMVIRNYNVTPSALNVVGNVSVLYPYINNDGKVRVKNEEIFYSGNEGAGSGLDADKLDGRNVTIESGASATCTDGVGQPRRAACLCFLVREQVSGTFTDVKKCTPLANHPM